MSIEVVTAAVAAGVAAPLLNLVKNWFARNTGANVQIKMPSGKVVTLDLDQGIGRDQASELVAGAAKSAVAGDEAGVRKAVEASHAASERARHQKDRSGPVAS